MIGDAGFSEIVQIGGWKKDPWFAPYPEGSRSKFAVFCPNDETRPFLIPGHRYLFKHSNPNFPSQFWAEVIARRIGEKVGVPVPRTFVSIDEATGGCAALIEWFYGPRLPRRPREVSSLLSPMMTFHRGLYRMIFGDFSKEPEVAGASTRYVPGSHYMVRMIPDYDLEKGRKHNIKSVLTLTSLLENGWQLKDGIAHWARVFLFDALIGNTDRHQDNWGVLWHPMGEGNWAAELAPAFDNGTALGHEILDDRLESFRGERLERYVERGTHHIRWEINDPRRSGHFDLLRRF